MFLGKNSRTNKLQEKLETNEEFNKLVDIKEAP